MKPHDKSLYEKYRSTASMGRWHTGQTRSAFAHSKQHTWWASRPCTMMASRAESMHTTQSALTAPSDPKPPSLSPLSPPHPPPPFAASSPSASSALSAGSAAGARVNALPPTAVAVEPLALLFGGCSLEGLRRVAFLGGRNRTLRGGSGGGEGELGEGGTKGSKAVSGKTHNPLIESKDAL
mmetsp:Transcript_2573/g.5252  ORF Transcript_2573/g.5252 Transcript_2573/m.5252 type:complete len:181 (+) Transcript_2573:156-698(+)